MTPQRTPSPDSRESPAASGIEPRTTPQESGHDDKSPHEHPKSDRAAPKPAADTRIDQAHRNDGEGSIESVNGSDEDSRSRRRDLGP
jgi:hypothetical protein